MGQIPLQKNTVALTSLAILAAMGIVVRMFVRIPVIPGLLDLTPGFLFSELGGVIGGLPGGALVGAIVGFGGAMAGGEPPLLPMLGNILRSGFYSILSDPNTSATPYSSSIMITRARVINMPIGRTLF